MAPYSFSKPDKRTASRTPRAIHGYGPKELWPHIALSKPDKQAARQGSNEHTSSATVVPSPLATAVYHTTINKRPRRCPRETFFFFPTPPARPPPKKKETKKEMRLNKANKYMKINQ